LRFTFRRFKASPQVRASSRCSFSFRAISKGGRGCLIRTTSAPVYGYEGLILATVPYRLTNLLWTQGPRAVNPARSILDALTFWSLWIISASLVTGFPVHNLLFGFNETFACFTRRSRALTCRRLLPLVFHWQSIRPL